MIRGASGQTHCGSWIPVPICEKYRWSTRLVCIRRPHKRGVHRNRDGWEW